MATGAAVRRAQAETYPSRPVRLVVGYTPGGSTDILARVAGQFLSEKLGQPIVVDNRPGAAGLLAAELVAGSPPDGYTLFMATAASHGISPALYRQINYDPIRDFVPVAFVGSLPLLLVVTKSLGVTSTQELIDLLKARPGEINYASSGNGSPVHLAGEIFRHMTGVSVQHIPYRGGAPSLTGLLAGEAQFSFATISSALPQVRGGSLVGLAVTTQQRSPAVPDIPTVADTVPGYEVDTWNGILAPRGTPAAIVEKVNTAMVEIAASQALKDGFLREGAVPDDPGRVRRLYRRWAGPLGAIGARDRNAGRLEHFPFTLVIGWAPQRAGG